MGQLAQGEQVVGPGPCRRRRLSARLEAAHGIVTDQRGQDVFADRLAARIVRPGGAVQVLGVRATAQQPGSHEPLQTSRDVGSERREAVCHGSLVERPEVPRPERDAEHGDAAIEPAILRVELVVRPVDRRDDRVEAVADSVEQRVRRKQPQERRRELERQGHPVELCHEPGDRGRGPSGHGHVRARPLRALDEEADRRARSNRVGVVHRPRQLEWVDGDRPDRRAIEGDPASEDDPQRRRNRHELVDEGDVVKDVLDRVEDQQRRPGAERACCRVGNMIGLDTRKAEGRRDRGGQAGVPRDLGE